LSGLGGQWYWPAILTAEQGTAATANGWPQFSSGGDPVLGPPHGFGVMQLELNPSQNGSADKAQLRLMFNWQENIEYARQLNQANADSAANRFWSDTNLWINHAQGSPPGAPPPQSDETAPPSPYSCSFAHAWFVPPFPPTGIRSYVDGMTVKLYNGADFPYVRWVNGPSFGWALAPTQLKFPGAANETCLRYVRRGCTWDFTNLPTVGHGCDAYHFQWVSGPAQ
jgi:hypothetical protein